MEKMIDRFGCFWNTLSIWRKIEPKIRHCHIDLQENKVKAFSIALLAGLLTLAGCGDRATDNKTEATASMVTENQSSTAAKKTGYFDEFILTPEEKFAETKKKAEAGDAQAQYNLGLIYNKGEGVTLDEEKGKEPWELDWSNRGKKLQTKAVEWFQKAAVQGHAEAQFRLGMMCYYGYEGVPMDKAKAAEWWQKAAAQGIAGAQSMLGMMYYFGAGVAKDAVKAAEWYQKAAAQGDAYAQSMLGEIYRLGRGVPKDMAKAAEWYQKAAAQGIANAQYMLAGAYLFGEGVAKDEVRAYAWLNLAAAQSSEKSEAWMKKRDRVEAQLTPAQRAEGQRLASNWKKGDALIASSNNASGFTSPDGKPTKQGTGTAFAVSGEGHALTNHHVINGCTEVKISGREGIVKVITFDSVNDLALLQVPGKTKDVASLNPDLGKLRQGEDIIVFGYPLDFVLSSGGNLTPGTISALTGLGNNTNQIQITAPIQPGSSGSPVMDKKGNVVGVVSMKLSDSKMAKVTGSVGQNVNFAVNGQTVKAFLDANKVPYKTGGGFFSLEKSNADIAEEASKWTVLVECWK